MVNADIDDVVKYGEYVRQSVGHYFENHNFEEAIVQCDRLIQLGQTMGRKNERIARLEIEGWINKSEALTHRGQWNEEKKIQTEILKVAQENGSKALLIDIYAWLSRTKEYAEKALALSKEIRYTKQLTQIIDVYFWSLTSRNITKEEYEESLQMGLGSLKLLKEVGEQEDCFSIYSSMISLCILEKDHEGALKYTHVFYEMAQQLENQENIAEAYGIFGQIYRYQKECSLALEYLQKALIVYKKENNEEGIVKTLQKIVLFYLEKRDYESALVYSQKIMTLYKNNETRIFFVKWNTTEIYKAQKKYDKALQLCFEALESMNKRKPRIEEWGLKSVMVDLYLQKQDFDKAISLGQEIAHKIMAQDSNSHVYKMLKGNFYSHLGDAYGLSGAYQLALEWYEKVVDMKDSTYKAYTKVKIAYCLFRMGNYAESKKKCIVFLETDEKNFRRYWQILLALVNFAIEEQQQAVLQFLQWMEEAEGKHKNAFHHALFLIKSGNAKVVSGVSSSTFLNLEEAEKHRQLAEIIHEHLAPQQAIDYLFLETFVFYYRKQG